MSDGLSFKIDSYCFFFFNMEIVKGWRLRQCKLSRLSWGDIFNLGYHDDVDDDYFDKNGRGESV